jgi:nucleoside-diphosphate-sugar epimerase
MNQPNNYNHKYQEIRVAILGASGFIGRWVARALCEQKAIVYLVVRNKAIAEKIFNEYRISGQINEVNLQDQEAVKRLFKKVRPSITFNLAGYGVDRSEQDEKIAYQINANFVKTICEVIAETQDPEWLGQDIVHVGSAFEYGTIKGNLSESSVPNPTTSYGKSKLVGTQFLSDHCRNRGIKGLTARLFTVYGPGEHAGRLLPSLLEATRTKEPIALTAGEQKRDFTYVEDVAEGLLRLGLTTSMPGDIVNLATGKLLYVRSFVEIAARILHIPHDRLRFGLIPTRSEEMKHNPVTLKRLRQLIAWVPPTGVAEGIQKIIDFKNQCNISEISLKKLCLL